MWTCDPQESRHLSAQVFFAFVSLRAVDRIFYKLVADRLVNYQLFFILLVPLGTQVAALPSYRLSMLFRNLSSDLWQSHFEC